MRIRRATNDDLGRISEIDRAAYSEYGGSKEWFAKKLGAFPEGMLVVEDKEKVTGVIVFEVIEKGNVPKDFSDMALEESINGKWMYTIVFTTATNYADKKADLQLLLAAEKAAKKLGCVESCVPLTDDHPYKSNGVFEFWESNGYRRIGKVKWVPSPNESFECHFYKKSLFNPQ